MATKLTKLDAVNIILSNIGQAPVTTVDNDNPMVALAANLLEEVSESVQAEGWVFNTERDYPFTPETDGTVRVSANILSLDDSYYSDKELIIRENKLYDKRAHTYHFEDPLKLTVVWLFDFEDLPNQCKQYIATRSANLFAGRSVGSQEAVKFGEREEAAARASLIEYETQQGDYNVLGTEDNRNTRTYRPFQVINRY